MQIYLKNGNIKLVDEIIINVELTHLIKILPFIKGVAVGRGI